jgi:Tat protein secretion system quality control protein TatD with DNase activity
MVKGRNEPVGTTQVALVVAQLKGLSLDEFARQVHANSVKMYGKHN